MEISKAIVESSWNPMAPSELICHILESTEGSFESVNYTSPFNNVLPDGGGFTGYPQKNDVVLIVQPGNDNEWYYMSTVVGVTVTDDDGFVVNSAKGSAIDPTDTRMRSVGLKGNAGQHLEFVDKASDSTKTQGISLTDGTSGRLTMVKGLNASVNMESGDDTRVKLTKGDNSASYQNAPDTLLAEAKGNTTLKSRAGALRLTVGSTGRKINITNWASRYAMRAGAWDIDAGDIDILSARNSVNIRAMSFLPTDLPSVFIEANRVIPTSVVQIRSGGRIELNSNLSIELTTLGVIRLNAAGGVYINGTTVNLNNPAFDVAAPPSLSNYEKSLGTAGGA